MAKMHLDVGLAFPGLIFILRATPVGDAVRAIALIATVLEPGDIKNRIEWAP